MDQENVLARDGHDPWFYVAISNAGHVLARDGQGRWFYVGLHVVIFHSGCLLLSTPEPNSVRTAWTSASTSATSAGINCGSLDPTRDGIARQPERIVLRIIDHSRSTASTSSREPRRRAFLRAMASACSYAKRARGPAAEAAASVPPAARNCRCIAAHASGSTIQAGEKPAGPPLPSSAQKGLVTCQS